MFVWVRAAPAPREEMMAAMALGALVLGVPHFEGSTTPSLAPKTGEAPAQQPQPPQPPQQQADAGHHLLKKMQKQVLAHEQKMKLEKAQRRARKLEEAREQNAGKQGHDKKELKKKVMAKKRLKNARARHHEAARVHNAEQEEVRQYNHARGAAEHTEEDESAGAGSLSQLFRNGIEFENRLRYGMLAPSDGKTCAASCNQQGQFRSHLYYVYQSRAGLSDRAWHIAHAQAVANSLCARLGLRPPYQVLASLHNHGADVKPEWKWNRYFDWADMAPPLRLDNDTLVPGDQWYSHGDCPAHVPGTPFLGPTDQEKSTTLAMHTARDSKTPFDWCLNYNIRLYIGSGGFESPSSQQKWPAGVPHEWCDMTSPWLVGEEDLEAERNHEFSLRPSGLVRGKALLVAKSLGLVLPNINGYQAENARAVTPPRSRIRLSEPSGTCPPVCFTRQNGVWYTKCGDRAEQCKDCAECSAWRPNSTTPRKADWAWPWESTPSEEPALSPAVGGNGLYALHVRRSDTLHQCDTRVLRQVKDGSARHLVPLALPSASASRAPSRRAFWRGPEPCAAGASPWIAHTGAGGHSRRAPKALGLRRMLILPAGAGGGAVHALLPL